jgi:hypothetical protein
MFHVELRNPPHVARAFNLSEEALRDQVVDAWLRGEVVDLGDQKWAPERARLTIYEGPRLRPDEISMGRGWSNATRAGDDVTDRILRVEQSTDAARSVAGFKRLVLERCADGRIGIHQVLWLANELHPESRASERLALAEQAVWELLHEGRLTMLRAGAGDRDGEAVAVAPEGWQPTLLPWATWADPRAPSVLLERAG